MSAHIVLSFVRMPINLVVNGPIPYLGHFSGTDELLLTSSLIRYQDVMKDVMAAHIELYGKSLHDVTIHSPRSLAEALLR